MTSNARCLLHIGRHKSGTSSLQAYLQGAAETLRPLGLLYPRTGLRGNAHHAMAEALAPRLVRDQPERSRQAVADFAHELALETRDWPGRVLLSSEGFQNVEPSAMTALCVPGQTQVLVYLREQADYLVSTYQQAVHARQVSDSLQSFSKRPPVNYDDFLQRWEEVYGLSQIGVGVYARSSLLRGNVIDDFFSRIGVDLRAPGDLGDQNPSIGGALLELKRIVNWRVPVARWPRQTYQAFGAVARSSAALRAKPPLDADRVQHLRETLQPSNARVARRHLGTDVLFTEMPELSRGSMALADFAAALSRMLEIRPDVAALIVDAVLAGPGDAMPTETERARVIARLRAGDAQPWLDALAQFDARARGEGWTWNFAVDSGW